MSLWPVDTVPTTFATADSGAIEVGVKFKSTVRGTVTGIRFYKGDGNTGTHVGNLWTGTGALLARVVFTDETPTGWQTARFGTPVAIQPDTVYVASYFAPNGRYAGVGGYFAASSRSVPPLYAFRDGEQGGNGVYARGTTTTFPNLTYDANNYYVDVLFLPETVGSGLRGEYFDDLGFTGARVSRIDATVNFSWGSGSPDPSFAPDTFSVRWTGQVLAPSTGTFTFTTRSDDGVRLWVNGQLLVDNWTDHAPTSNSGQIALTGGQKYDLKLEYYENLGAATMGLDWVVPGAQATVIPTANLFPSPDPGPAPDLGPRWFRFGADMTGGSPASWSQVLADRLKFDGFGTWPPLPVPASMQDFIRSSTYSYAPYVPAANRDMPSYLYTHDPAQLQALEATLRGLTTSDESKIFWSGMAEFDQFGGDWATGRPVPSTSLTRQQNYERFRDFYVNTLGLGSFLGRTRAQRGYGFRAVSDYSWSAHWAYEWGADMVLGERILDDLSGIIPSASFYRGAGKQFGKPWGFDFSTWRYWTFSPTEYDSNNRLTGGWSASWFKRHMYIVYMSGANALQMEPALYFSPSGVINPLGTVVAEFADFALRRHTNRPPEHVPFALIVDRYSAFDPKFGEFMQGNYVFHARLPYDAGDYMLNNVLRMAYPEHWLHGTLVPGGPQTIEEFRARLAAGADPRPWEPMGKSRWGDVFNVLNNATTATGLGRHRVAMLTTHVAVDSTLRGHLQQYVQNGGVLILNAAQVSAADTTLTGASLTGQTAQSTSSQWVADGASFTEPAYTYARLNLQGATVVARNAAGDPLITRYAVGAGEVYLTTPTLLQDNNRSQILNIGQKLFDVLNSRYAPARVQGPSILYLLNTDSRVTTVTLVNGGGATWTGTLTFPAPTGAFRTTEWTGDTAVANTVAGGQVSVSASVPPYEVRVYALERTTP